MDSAKTLYKLLNIIIILLIFSIGLGIVLIILISLNILPSSVVSIQSDLLLYKKDPGLYVFITLMLIIYLIFVYGIWKLREASKFLLAHEFYTNKLVKNIIVSGKCMILTGVFAWVIDGLSGIYFKQVIRINISDKTFVYLFFIAMGLFMILIGKVLNDAKKMKEENDLTI